MSGLDRVLVISWLDCLCKLGSSISHPRNLHQGHNCSSKLVAGMLIESRTDKTSHAASTAHLGLANPVKPGSDRVQLSSPPRTDGAARQAFDLGLVSNFRVSSD